MRRAHAALLAALVLALAGCEDKARNEAKLFLAKVADVDENAPPERRQQEVDALRELVLTTDEVRHAQRSCVAAHEALLHAEEEQAGASHALEQVAARVGPHTPLSAADQAAVQARIDASNRAITDARAAFPRCQHEVDALKERYGDH